ncbi:MAG: Atg14 domain-containing protein, partial [Candidatus Thiosymbion ectosymbiont of Robbea hypermnestra]|nr:Atg14 domain-containing protein [Candidatus Thiosymbion ectosymbiont of Robbea hypermnestra]
MKQPQRKFRAALFGLLAVATVVGGGWAVHVALLYQDNSNTVTDGGVINQGIQHHQGDTNTATQGGVVTGDIQGSGVAINTGSGDINIGISLEQYKADLKEREQEVRAEEHKLRQALQQAHAKEREGLAQKLRDLEAEKAELARRMADTESSYQDHIKELKERIAHLETIRGQVPDELLDQARDALQRGDQDKTDRLFAELETRTQAAIQAAAEAAYQRSRIALDQIRYR